MSYIRGNKRQIFRRKLNRKQIKFLMKFCLLLEIPEERFTWWERRKPTIKINKIYKLLIRGYYSEEKEVEDILSQWVNFDCKFIFHKTTEVWDYSRYVLEEMMSNQGVALVKGSAKVYEFPRDIARDIHKTIKKKRNI